MNEFSEAWEPKSKLGRLPKQALNSDSAKSGTN